MIRSDLNVARERNQRLYAHAAPVMHMLFEQIVNTESMIVLTDAQGTILHSVGDDEFLGWSQAWRLKMRDERAQQLLTVDPHAPPDSAPTAPPSTTTVSTPRSAPDLPTACTRRRPSAFASAETMQRLTRLTG